MMYLKAPYPILRNVTMLPGPLFSDSRSIESTLTLKRALDGTKYTHLHTTQTERFVWSFELLRMKSLELIEFHREYIDNLWQVTDHKGREIVGLCLTNPIELTPQKRAHYGEACGAPKISHELVTVELEFEGRIL